MSDTNETTYCNVCDREKTVIEAELCDMCTECVEIHDELDEPE